MTEVPTGWRPKANLLEKGAIVAGQESDIRSAKIGDDSTDVKLAGILPAETTDGQESSKLAVPAEVKAEIVAVSPRETKKWKNVEEFVSHVPKEGLWLKSKGGARKFYKRDGDKLYNKDGNNVTGEAFKRYSELGWVIILPESGASKKGSTSLAESGVVVPAATGAQAEGSQLEESESFKVFREKLDSFDSKFEEMLQKANTLSALKSLYNHVKSKKTTSDGKSIYLSEVIWHNFLSEITPVYSPLPPEQKTVASSLLEGKNNEYAREIKKKEKGFKELKEQEFYQIRNDKEFSKIVDKKVSEITEKIELAQSLTELENIGQVRSVSKNVKERRFLSAEMFVDIENDPAMIVHINRVFDVEEDAVEKRILACWEGRFQALTSEIKAVKKQFDDVIEEKRRLAKERLGDSSDELLRKRYKEHMGYLSQFGQGVDVAFERNDIEELNRALRAANEVKFVVEEEKEELTNEELFTILVEALKSKKRPFGRDKEGKELVIESISDTEIRYHYGADKTVTTPADVKDLLRLLIEDYGWEPRVLTKRRVAVERKEAERIRIELGTVISEKKALFQTESTRVSASQEVLDRNIAYLDSIVVRAQKAFVAGDIEYLRGVLKMVKDAVFKLEEPKKKKGADSKPAPAVAGVPADGMTPDVDESGLVNPYYAGLEVSVDGNEPAVPVAKDKATTKNNTLRGVAMRDLTVHNIFDRNSFEGLNDSEEERGQTEEEKRYGELERDTIKAKRKQYESVVTEGMAPFVEYVEQNPTLTLQAIINNDQYGGIEKVARAFAKVLEAILPSTWSDADRKLFAFVFTKKQIEDLFE